jgi:hypothetical protein
MQLVAYQRRVFRRSLVLLVAVTLLMAIAVPVGAKPEPSGFLTDQDPFITLDPGLPDGASVLPILSVGDIVDGEMFEGLPDGIGLRPGPDKHTVEAFVVHEQTTVPFFGSRDFQEASVTSWVLSTKSGPSRLASVLASDEPIGPEAGFLRFCSASMAGPNEGLSSYIFFANEETDDAGLGVPSGATYGADTFPGDGTRQGGYSVALDPDTGNFTSVAGLGRLNHENTIVVPGGWDGITLLTTDDTFNAPSAQLYMYLAGNVDDIFNDNGTLWAFRVTAANGGSVNAADPFNDANDYLDLAVGDEFAGEFIPVPDDVAAGTTNELPQDALENWSNDNNVFQAIRLEDLAYDKNNPRIVYVADTGRTRIIPDDTTGRMQRGPGGTVGQADNGRIFKFVFNADDPTVVDSVTVIADGDAASSDVYVPFVNPDNIDTSRNSLMVQEDNDNARIWQHRFNQGWWRVVATVNDPDGESSGIVDASEYFGPGTWLLDVQAHGVNVDEEIVDGITFKREDGQLMLMKIPAS